MTILVVSAQDVAEALGFIIFEVVAGIVPDNDSRTAILESIANGLDDSSKVTIGGCQAIIAVLAHNLIHSEN